MKEEALKLADDLEELHEQDLIDGVAHLSMPQASAMIRRLVEELDRLDYDLKSLANRYKALDRTKPLSDEEIKQIIKDCIEDDYNMIANPYALARAIEERHGIK